MHSIYSFSQHRLIWFGLGGPIQYTKSDERAHRGECRRPLWQSAPVHVGSAKCILFRIFLYMASHSRPSICLRQHPWGPWLLDPTRRDCLCLQQANRVVFPAFLAMTACWDIDKLCSTCFWSDWKQISLASFTQLAKSVSTNKIYPVDTVSTKNLCLRNYDLQLWLRC
jgi:hypothetical protein